MKFNLADKVALVTGGSSGIGKAIATNLAEHGCKVIINYSRNQRNAQKIAETVNGLAMKANVINYGECQNMVRKLLSKYHVLDFLINNVGGSCDKTLKNMAEEEWDYVMDLNLKSVFNLTKSIIPHSVSGQIGSFGQTNYSAAKAGVIGFTKALAREVAFKGITVNAIAPGLIYTPHLEKIPKDRLQEIVSKVPLQRIGKPEEIAHAVLFLLENNYITGQTINVNGGLYM